MRIDAPLANGNPATPCWTGRHVVQMLQAACVTCPHVAENILRDRVGSSDPTDLTPAKLAELTEHVFLVVKQYGIKDPTAFLAYQVQLEAEEAAAKLGSSAEIGNIAAQPKSADRAAATIENNSSTNSVALPRPAAPRVTYGTTKAEVLSGAKAAVDAGEDRRRSAERLACAQEDFGARQREIARAIDRSASWVNRLLKWRLSGYKQSSPFGPTTRAGRAARRKINENDIGRRGGSGSLLFGASATGPSPETSSSDIRKGSSDEGDVSQIDRCSVSHQPPPIPPSGNENFPGRSIQNEVLLSDVAAGETEVSKTPPENPDGERNSSGSRPREEQKRPSENPRAGQKRTPELMRLIVDSLKECPILARAAFKAGIHRKTLENWLKCSTAGFEGYEMEYEGERYRFHEFCDAAIAEAHDTLEFLIWQSAHGIKYKIDPLLERLGYRGVKVYATDANGDFIEEGVRKPNMKMMRFYLAWKRPERYGKPRKRGIAQTGAVLIVGERGKPPKTSYEASARARHWKAGFSRL